MNNFSRFIARHYDRQVHRQRPDGLYEGSDWLNFGYWKSDTTSVREACENLVEELVTLMPNTEGLILDVGCGKGMTARQLAKYFGAENIFGINISTEHLERCNDNAPGSTFFEMDATDMTFPDESFEHVICVEAAFHFNTRAKFLEEAYRVLRPGGVLTLSDILTDAWSLVQPRENRIRDIESYGKIFEDIGFTNLRIIDATKECQDGFHDALLRVFRQKLDQGEISSGFFSVVNGQGKRAARKQKYVLACCAKP